MTSSTPTSIAGSPTRGYPYVKQYEPDDKAYYDDAPPTPGAENNFTNVKGLWAKNQCFAAKSPTKYEFTYCDYFKFLEPKRDKKGNLADLIITREDLQY
jgi:hypothetical protein